MNPHSNTLALWKQWIFALFSLYGSDKITSKMKELSLYTYAEICLLVRQDIFARVRWPFFASGFLPCHHPLATNRLSSQGRKFLTMANSYLQKHGPWNSYLAMATCVALANFLSQKHALCFFIPARVTFVARAKSPFFSPIYVYFIDSCLDHSFPG